MRRGKVKADADVSKSLLERALGYNHKAVKFFQNDGVVISQEYTEHYPPDTAAASLWLRNRQPDKWRDKPEFSLSVENNVTVDTSKPVEEMGESELYAECKRRGLLPTVNGANRK